MNVTTPFDDELQAERTRLLIEQAVAGLDAADVAERRAWCEEHNEFGVRMFPAGGDELEFRWGGRLLAVIRQSDLVSEEPLRGEFVPEVPDTVPDWLNDGE
jgi:hypothetical protein